VAEVVVSATVDRADEEDEATSALGWLRVDELAADEKTEDIEPVAGAELEVLRDENEAPNELDWPGVEEVELGAAAEPADSTDEEYKLELCADVSNEALALELTGDNDWDVEELKVCVIGPALALGSKLLELVAPIGWDEDELKLCAAVIMLELRLLELLAADTCEER
jgi:hypothetical protein